MQEATLKKSKKVKRRNMKNVILFFIVCDMFSTVLCLDCYSCTFNKTKNETCSATNSTRSCDLNQNGCYVKIDEKMWYTLDCYTSKTQCENDSLCANEPDCNVTCCNSGLCNNPGGQPSVTPTSLKSTITAAPTGNATTAPTPTGNATTPPGSNSGCNSMGVKTLHFLALSVITSSLIITEL